MARKSKIRFEWDGDREGRLWAIRDKGQITMDDLMVAMNEGEFGEMMQGRLFATMFLVSRDKLQPTGWMDEDEPEGDVWQLWEVADNEPCPLCGKLLNIPYCPDCGKYILPPEVK